MRLILAAALVAAALSGCAGTSSSFGDCTGTAEAGYGSAVASGGCGDCQGQAGAGYGEAEASGGCGDCRGEAGAGYGEAEASGQCASCSGSAQASAGGSNSEAMCTGCSASASAGSTAASGSDQASLAAGGCVISSTRDVELYKFAGTVTGASAPDPMGSGPASGEVPPAKTASFEVANGTLKLAYVATFESGAGGGRIEIVAPDGSLAYEGETAVCVGPGGPTCAFTSAQDASDGFAPGTYTVNYYLSGSLEVAVSVVATVPA